MQLSTLRTHKPQSQRPPACRCDWPGSRVRGSRLLLCEECGDGELAFRRLDATSRYTNRTQMSRERPRARLGSHTISSRRKRANDRHAHGTFSNYNLTHSMDGSQCCIQPVPVACSLSTKDLSFTIPSCGLSSKRTWWCGGRFFQPFSALPRPMTNSTPTYKYPQHGSHACYNS
jgi:hypothetical protein